MQTMKGMGVLYFYMFYMSPFFIGFLLDGGVYDLLAVVVTVIVGSWHASKIMCEEQN